jgi:GntR family transcriptional regulator
MARESSVAETLRRRLLADMESNDLGPGARLGSEREMSERYGVSRGTLRLVLASLEDVGLIQRSPGRAGGTFVGNTRIQHDLTHAVGLPAHLQKHGYVAGTRVLATGIETPDRKTAQALQLAEGQLVISVRRLRLANGVPISLDLARFPADRFPSLLDHSLSGSIYQLLEDEFAVRVADAEEIVEVVRATDDEAALLAVPEGDPLVAITRIGFDADGRPIEYSADLLRSDRVRIALRTPGAGLRAPIADDAEHFATITPVAGSAG